MKPSLLLLAPLSFALLAGLTPHQDEAEPAGASAFSSTTIDVGVVVSDIEAAARFYGETLGFLERPGFRVGADFCRDAGLTDSLPLDIRVFALGDGPGATKLKLMQVAGAEPETSDNAFVHSQLGLSYLTVYVSDLTNTMARLEAAGVSPLAQGPVPLGTPDEAPHLILVRDPDGNLVELIGPRR